jgi:hydroxymethylglutaryl-CoA synthase
MVGIHAFGGYVPRLRLQREAVFAATGWFNAGLAGLAKGERAVASWDEDVITMAVEAARDCLGAFDRRTVGRVTLASTSFPNADRQNSTVVKEALNLPDEVAAFDVAGSQRAGTSSLLDSCYAAAGGAGTILCVASERARHRPGSEAELAGAHAAGAVLIAEGAGAARFVGGHSTSIDFVDHFRATGESFDYQWESRWVRDEGYAKIVPQAVNAALMKLGLTPKNIDHFIMGTPMKGVNAGVAKAVGIDPRAVSDTLSTTLGDAGAAQPLVLLSHVLERAGPNETIMLVGFGGGCDVLVFQTTNAIIDSRPTTGVVGTLAERKSEIQYIRFLAFSGLLELEKGMRAEFDQKPVLTALYRERKTVLGLVGGKCTQSGTVQFPKTPISVATNARATRTQEDYPLADRIARVISYTIDHLTSTPDPPAYYGAVEFEGGGRLTTEFVDLDEGDVKVGLTVRMVFRVKAFDERRGFTKYFWKAVPDRRGSATSKPQRA